MSRPRIFDSNSVLNRIADTFTTHGYGGTSMSLLTEATGLGKQSLYNAFGDKRELYLQALDRAASRWSTVMQSMLKAKTGMSALQRFNDSLIESCLDPDPSVHCCIVSSGLLEDIQDESVRAALGGKWQSTEQMLYLAVVRGQRDGTVRTDQSANDLAQLLMTMMSGLRVSVRAGVCPSQLRKIAGLTLAALEPPN